MADNATAAIAKIEDIMNIIYNTTNPIPEQILKVMALFDTSHDFGKYSICYDTLSAASRSDTNKSEYTNQRMAFSALSKLVFDIGSDKLSRVYGSLRTPAQYYSSALQAKNLENSFMLYAEKYVKDKGTFIESEFYRSDNGYYDAVYGALDRYRNSNSNSTGTGTTLVPLLVDTQKKIYKYTHFKEKFMVPILRESVYDAAPKLKPSEDSKNVYYEVLRNSVASNMYNYNETIQTSGVFVGNIPVSLGPIDQTQVENGTYKINVKVDNKNIEVIGNAGAKHKNSITVLNKQISENQKNKCVNIGNTMYMGDSDTMPYSGYVKSFKNTINRANGCLKFKDNNINFTLKRTSDGNQASICDLVNKGTVNIKVAKKGTSQTEIDLTKLVLVTIDRMLYAIALILNIPVIFEHHQNNRKCYIPNGTQAGPGTTGTTDTVFGRGGSNIKLNNYPYTLNNHQSGGTLTITNGTMDDSDSKYILDTPNYILALIPFIHKTTYNNISSDYKKAFENIVSETYITCSNTVTKITDPSRTNFLRNYRDDGDISMNDLIGIDDSGDTTNINIIDLLSGDYKLKYKYNKQDDTYDEWGRLLTIYKNDNPLGNITSDPFGSNRIRDIFSDNITYDNSGSILDVIEGIMDELGIQTIQNAGKSSSSPLASPLASPEYIGPSPDSKDSIGTLYTVPLDSKSEFDIKTSDGNKTDLSKYPLLTKYNNYYAVAFNYVKTQEKLGKEINVELSNKFTLFAYLWMFNNYVIHVCIDDEETAIAYDEWTVKDDNRHVLVPTHKSLYLLFKNLVDTFKTENKLPFLLTDLEQVLYNENDYMYFQLQQIKDYTLKDDYISVIDINVESSTSKISNYAEIKNLITKMNEMEIDVCEYMNKEDNFDKLLNYAIDNMLTRYGMFYMNTDYLNYIGEDKQSHQVMAENNVTRSGSTLGGNRRKKSKKQKKIRKYKQTKRYIRHRNKKISSKRKNTRKYKKLNNIKKTRKKKNKKNKKEW